MSPNVPLFEHIAKRADEMYADCVERALSHKRAGRRHMAAKSMADARAYLQFRRSAQRNLVRAMNRKAAA